MKPDVALKHFQQSELVLKEVDQLFERMAVQESAQTAKGPQMKLSLIHI